MIKRFSLPDYYGKIEYIINFIKFRQEHQEYFYNDRIIDSCYGAHPDILWAGGRRVGYDHSMSMQQVLEEYSAFPEVELRHVCTNYFINQEIAHDYKTNYFMQHYLRDQDKLIVANELLINFLKQNYPNTKLIYSTTLNITDIKEVNKISKDHIYVLNYNYNNNNEYLEHLENIHNIEILCAEPCQPNCPLRLQHYKHISMEMLGLTDEEFICHNNQDYRFKSEIMQLPTAVTSERVDELANMGIQYFKISGRLLKVPAWLDLLVYYLVLPQYQELVFMQLLNSWW